MRPLRPTESKELLSESQLLNDFTVSLDILLRKIVEQVLSVTNHTEQTSLRVEVLLVSLQMLGKRVDSVSENSYLYLGRTCVSLIDLISINELLLKLLIHVFFTFLIYLPKPQGAVGEATVNRFYGASFCPFSEIKVFHIRL